MAGLPENALSRASLAIVGKTGPGTPVTPAGVTPAYGSQKNAFKDPVTPPFQQNVGPRPNKGQPWALRFIPPLSLFNDAAQWVYGKYFVRPQTFQQNPDSNPILVAQYGIGPPPQNVSSLAAGALNLQLQLGATYNQVQQLTQDESNFYGG